MTLFLQNSINIMPELEKPIGFQLPFFGIVNCR